MTTSTPSFLRVTGYRSYAFRLVWRSSVANSILSPVVFLVAMGLGVGSYIDDTSSLGGVEYIVFLAPGLLAATAMNVAVSEGTFPIFSSVHWNKVAYGQIATPVSPADIAWGQITWAALRILLSSALFLGVTVLFGAVVSPWAVLAVPAAVLVGLAFATPMMAWAIGLERMTAFVSVQRFLIAPMFLFSGTFFPVSQLPDVVEPLAYLTPLWHGVRLTRSLALGEDVVSLANLGHIAVLSIVAVVGALLAVRAHKKRLLL